MWTLKEEFCSKTLMKGASGTSFFIPLADEDLVNGLVCTCVSSYHSNSKTVALDVQRKRCRSIVKKKYTIVI